MIHRLVLFAWLFLALAPARVFGAGSFPCPAEPIRLAYYEFGHFYTAGAGLDADVAAELQKRSGCRFESSVRPRARIWWEIEAGQLDMTVSGIDTPERSRFAWFYPYLRQKNYAVFNTDLTQGADSMAEFAALPGLYWGAIRGFRHGARLDAQLEMLRAQDRVIEAVDASQLFLMLSKRRVAAIFAQPLLFEHQRTAGNLPEAVRILDLDPQDGGVPLHLVLSRKRFTAEEARAWGDLVARLRSDGTMKRLLGRYLDKHLLRDSLLPP